MTNQWTESLTNYHGLPRDTFDNFGWHKSLIYDFTITPPAYAPVSIHFGKRYVEYDKLTINNSYDNGLRIYKKTNSRFNNETFQYFDTNGLMSGVLYRAVSGYTGCWPNGKLNFSRDNSGLIEQITEDLALTANYNADLEITSVNHTVPQPFDESYTYDSRGNRLTDLSQTYLYDNLNKLIESTTHLYGYDLDGNLTLEKNKLTSETKKYYWDSENRLIKYEHQATDISPIDITAEYKYDIYGRRIQKNVNDTITNFSWEGDNLSMELDATNQPIRKYFTETSIDDFFGHLEYSEVTNWSKIFDYSYPQGWYGYIKDQVGSIYRVWDRNLKQYAEARTYDTFGNLLNFTGSTKTNIGFQGKYFDHESGLNYFYHRYYYASLGRFISEDKIGFSGGHNFYAFVGDDAVNFIDPLGFYRTETPEECKWIYSKKLFSYYSTEWEKKKTGKYELLYEGEQETYSGTVPGNALTGVLGSTVILQCVFNIETQITTRKFLRNVYFVIYQCGECSINLKADFFNIKELVNTQTEIVQNTCGFKVATGVIIDFRPMSKCEDYVKMRCLQ